MESLRYIPVDTFVARLVNRLGETVYQLDTSVELYSTHDYHVSLPHPTGIEVYMSEVKRLNIQEY